MQATIQRTAMKFDHGARYRWIPNSIVVFNLGATSELPRRQFASTESMNLDDGSSAKLTTRFDNFPAWSPKGDVTVFTGEDDYDIYTIRPYESGLRRLLHRE